MFKAAVVSLLLVALAAQTFNSGFIMLDFFLHQSYIAQNLCINKDKPQMKCCGRCQLRKKIAQENSTQGQLPARKYNMTHLLFFNDIISASSTYVCAYKSGYPELVNYFPSTVFFDILHPPQATFLVI